MYIQCREKKNKIIMKFVTKSSLYYKYNSLLEHQKQFLKNTSVKTDANTNWNFNWACSNCNAAW